jgi:choline dehydrogenase-like flavoprotein
VTAKHAHSCSVKRPPSCAPQAACATIARPIDSFTHRTRHGTHGRRPGDERARCTRRFRGFTNLFVADGSALPTSAAVNPALTIAANALRIGAHLAESRRWLRPLVRRERRDATHVFA